MLRKFAAVSIAVVWLFLFTVDMAEDSGLIADGGAELDQSVDAVLADFGEAIKISVDSQVVVSLVSSGQPAAAFPALVGYSIMPARPFVSPGHASRRTPSLKQSARIYQLHKVFLI